MNAADAASPTNANEDTEEGFTKREKTAVLILAGMMNTAKRNDAPEIYLERAQAAVRQTDFLIDVLEDTEYEREREVGRRAARAQSRRR